MIRLIRESPATIAFCLSWILVYAAMVHDQGRLAAGANPVTGGVRLQTTERFGTVTSAALRSGEIWRPLTATFIHFSILHLTLNLIAFYQLGAVVESWYGSPRFVGLYVAIGWTGNVLAELARPLAASALRGWAVIPDPQAGGGSGVVCGLIALIAVVGKRSRRPKGRYIAHQMIAILIFTALLGLVIPIVDNFGHAGGAIAGAVFGLAHRRFWNRIDTVGSWIFGLLGLVFLGYCATAQYQSSQATDRILQARERVTRSSTAMVLLVNAVREMAHLAETPWPFGGRADLLTPLEMAPSRKRMARELNNTIAQLHLYADELGVDAQGPVARLDEATREVAFRLLTPGEIRGRERDFQILFDLTGRRLLRDRQELERLQKGDGRRSSAVSEDDVDERRGQALECGDSSPLWSRGRAATSRRTPEIDRSNPRRGRW